MHGQRVVRTDGSCDLAHLKAARASRSCPRLPPIERVVHSVSSTTGSSRSKSNPSAPCTRASASRDATLSIAKMRPAPSKRALAIANCPASRRLRARFLRERSSAMHTKRRTNMRGLSRRLGLPALLAGTALGVVVA